MLVRADIGELWDTRVTKGIACCHPQRTDVSVIDCGWFADKQWWPSVAQMKPSGWRVFEYLQLLQRHQAIEAIVPWAWNDCDGKTYASRPEDSKLVHYTSVPEQPYRPYPDTPYGRTFPFCRNRAAGELWFDEFREAATEAYGPAEAERLYWELARP